MTPTTTGTTQRLRLERTFTAPPEAVFDAWTNPEVLKRWWGASPAHEPGDAEVDLRAGGRYRLAMRNGETGDEFIVGGEYVEVSRPDRLVYTWRWETPPGEEESVVTVSFVAAGDGMTTVVLEHTGLASEESAQSHSHGWAGCFDSLAAKVFFAGEGA